MPNYHRAIVGIFATSSLFLATAASAGSGVVTTSGTGYTKNSACSAAKAQAQGAAAVDSARTGKLNVRITSRSACSCETYAGAGTPSITMWSCTVDSTYES